MCLGSRPSASSLGGGGSSSREPAAGPDGGRAEAEPGMTPWLRDLMRQVDSTPDAAAAGSAPSRAVQPAAVDPMPPFSCRPCEVFSQTIEAQRTRFLPPSAPPRPRDAAWPALYAAPPNSNTLINSLWPDIRRILDERAPLLQAQHAVYAPPPPARTELQAEHEQTHTFWLLQLDARVVLVIAFAGRKEAGALGVSALLKSLSDGLRDYKIVERCARERGARSWGEKWGEKWGELWWHSPSKLP